MPTAPGDFAKEFGIKLNVEKDELKPWQSVHFLFQLTTGQLTSATGTLFRENVDKGRADSYLFFAVELRPEAYVRGKLATMARELNRHFKSPILLLLKAGSKLTLAIVDRRPNKKDGSKDVLEKVTLIKDIDVAKPHAAHIRILEELALSNLNVQDWDSLHKAWRKVLDLSELNKKFFRELSNWYFWARGIAHFPDAKDENEKSVAVIRLITRIMFVYFIKERGLVPAQFFDQAEARRRM